MDHLKEEPNSSLMENPCLKLTSNYVGMEGRKHAYLKQTSSCKLIGEHIEFLDKLCMNIEQNIGQFKPQKKQTHT